VRAAAARGVLTGHPVVDVAVRLVDGATHTKDSSPAAFEIAGSLAFQRAVRDGGVVLEPLAHAPVLYGGEEVPLASTFDWVSRLRSITGGRGTAVVKAEGYGVLPEAEARTLVVV
jgi:elongation factor G